MMAGGFNSAGSNMPNPGILSGLPTGAPIKPKLKQAKTKKAPATLAKRNKGAKPAKARGKK